MPSVMRDPTRGGLASVLGEIVEEGSFGIELQEGAIPYDPGARAVSEILGIDLLHVGLRGAHAPDLFTGGSPGHSVRLEGDARGNRRSGDRRGNR